MLEKFKGKILNKYEYPYSALLHLVREEAYSCIDLYVQELEEEIINAFREYDLQFIAHPDRSPILDLELDDNYNIIPHSIDNDTGHKYLLAIISAQAPIARSQKPSGFILNDYSYLQIEQTVAWSLDTQKLYLLKYSYHYGRSYLTDRGQEEKYYFRYDKESDHQYVNVNDRINKRVRFLDFKPIHHFHGNSRDPHFREPDCPKKIREIIETLSKNLYRLEDLYDKCTFSQFPVP